MDRYFQVSQRSPFKLLLLLILAGFQGYGQSPVITAVSPASGVAGSTVVIYGANFNTSAAANTVYFGGARASVTSASATSLSVVVPAGTTYTPVTVTVNGLTGYSSAPFLLTFTGTGNFSAASFDPVVDEQTDLHPNGLVMADFDGDGLTDLATPNNYNNSGTGASISVLHNQTLGGSIGFGQAINFPTGFYTDALAVGDIDGDGKPDLVSVSVQANTVSILLNNSPGHGDIGFAAGPSYATGTSPSAVAVYDLDGDGRPDIIVLNEISNTLSIYRNTSSGGVVSFAARVDVGTGLTPTGMAVGDLDGDGKADIAVVNNLSNTVSLYRNVSSVGTIALASRSDMATTGGSDNPYAVAIADLDGDRKADLIISNNNVTTINAAVVSLSVFRNTGSAGSFSFANAVNFGSGNSYQITVGDLNGDGKPDVVVPVLTGNTNVYVNFGSAGTISLAAPVLLTSGSPYAPGIGDLDGDGVPDLAVSNFTLSSVSVFRSRVLQPTITGVSPLTGFQGDTVTITGFNFTGCTYATIDNIIMPYFKVVSDTKIIIVVGNAASGTVDVTGPHGSGTFPGFVYSAPPTIQSFSPTSAGEGQTVTITGTNFFNLTGVSFGGVPASYDLVSSNTIHASPEAGATGIVSVSNIYGTGSLPGFTFLVLPKITSLVPVYAGDGIPITINGQNFKAVTSVTFGGVPAASYTVVDSTTITAAPAAGASGEVVVTTTQGTDSISPFFWLPPPTITSMSPTSGIYGTVITLTGSNFTDGHFGTFRSVSIGGVDYTQWAGVSPNTITITLDGPFTSGDINVTTWGGKATIPGFVYYGRPALAAIRPNIAGTGMPVTILGANFVGVTSVSLGGVPVSSFTVVSPDSITAIVGAGASGDVIITNPAGSDITNPSFIFTEAPLIFSYSPDTGRVGTIVTINGGNFAPGDIVSFGGVRATPISVSLTQLTVAVPPGAGYGPVGVTSPKTLQAAYADHPFTVTFPTDPTAFNAASFAGHMEFATGVMPTDLAMGDLDGDGKQDVAVVNFLEGTVSVFRNTSTVGAISFAPRMDIVAGSYTKNIGIADIDGDGKPDIVVGQGNSDNCVGCGPAGIIILRNISTPGKLAFSAPIFISSYFKMDYMAIGDLNRDGKPDIVGGTNGVVEGGEPQGTSTPVYYFENTSANGNISFDQHDFALAGGGLMQGIAVRDVDGDGFPDVIVGMNSYSLGYGYDVMEAIMTVDGYGPIIPNTRVLANNYYDPGTAYPVATDFTHHGYTDIVTTDGMFGNNENGGFSVLGINPVQVGPGVAADLNGDGMPDEVRTGQNGDSVILIFKDSTASPVPFAPVVTYPALNSFKHVIAGDLDGDGKPEIVVSNKSYNSISVFRNRIGEPALPAPLISSFTPDSGGFSTAMTISGIHFSQATAVAVGGVAVSTFHVIDDGQILAVVDTGASGPVSVTTPGGTATAGDFVYHTTAQPIIRTISPMIAASGTTLVITGANFSSVTNVSFGTAPAAKISIISPNTMLITVDSATSDTVTVTNAAGSADTTGFLFVATPAIQTVGSNPICSGQRAMLVAQTPNSGPAYQWYNGATAISGANGDTLAVDSAGTYSVLTSVSGVISQSSASVAVAVNLTPQPPVISQKGNLLISSRVSGNLWYTDTSSAPIDTNRIHAASAAATFWLRDSTNGCFSDFSGEYVYKTKPHLLPDTSLAGAPLAFGPNPATTFIVVDFHYPQMSAVHVEIFDINGRLVADFPSVSSGERLDISALRNGYYIIKGYDFKANNLAGASILKL